MFIVPKPNVLKYKYEWMYSGIRSLLVNITVILKYVWLNQWFNVIFFVLVTPNTIE